MTHTTKHTPGPWIIDNEVSEDIAGQPTLGIYADGPEEYGYVCGIHCGPDADITEQDYVNATLIAAAPAMYADLCAVRDYLFELYDEGNAKAGEYAASLGITIEQAEGRHHE